ncbi:MAG: hypothetical protein IJ584_10810 [Bacteroidales bacterium]|nr:hypothetical protein [Bacteroidales bacterium]
MQEQFSVLATQRGILIDQLCIQGLVVPLAAASVLPVVAPTLGGDYLPVAGSIFPMSFLVLLACFFSESHTLFSCS